jgi:serine protease Do
MGALEELQQAIAKVAERTAPAVVGIGGHWRRGSGVIVAENRVLTNAHNVHGDGATCVFADGRKERGRLLGEDMDGDLAVLEVDTAGAKPLPWASGALPAVGTAVFAVVSAASGGGVRTTIGLVSGVERSFRGPGGRLIGSSIEHTAPLASGSSGSPIVDADGRLVGLNTQRLGEGFYLALPADESLKRRIDALGRGESTVRPSLGIAVAPGHVARHLRRAVGLPDREGVLVRGVEPESPADAAGIREGDLIVAAAGSPITNPDELHEALDKAGAGKKAAAVMLELGVVRGAEELTVKVDLAAGPAKPAD